VRPLLFLASLLSSALPAAAQIAPSAPPRTKDTAPVPCLRGDPGRAAYSGSVELASFTSCAGGSAWPWVARAAPGGPFLYVSLFGGIIGSSGCEVLKLDARTHAVVRRIPTGLGPQEIVFLEDGDGRTRYWLVANSTASSVSVFDSRDELVTEIALPFDAGAAWPTAFPSGLAVAPDQSRVFVGTLDDSGRVFAIDTASFTLAPAETLTLGADHTLGRMLFAGGRLVVPATLHTPDFSASTAKLVFVDPRDPSTAAELVLASASDGIHFPSVQDLELACDGRLFAAGFDMGPQVFVVDPAAAVLLGTIPTGTPGPGKFQALALSERGLLVVADLWYDEVAFLDAWRESWIETLDLRTLPLAHDQVNELVFERSGRLVAVCQASDNLAVFGVR